MNAKDRSKNAFALLVDSTNQGVLAGLKIVQVDPYDARGLAWGAIETNIGRDKVHVNIAYSNHNDQITLALQQAAQAGAAATREKLEALRRVGPNERVIVNYELDCPPPVDGESLGLACGLVLAEYVVRHGGLVTSEELAKREPPVANPAPQLPETYAATGCIPRRGGDITGVGGLEAKLEQALEALPEKSLIFYPPAQAEPLPQALKDRAAGRDITLCPVHTVAEALEQFAGLSDSPATGSQGPWRLVLIVLLAVLVSGVSYGIYRAFARPPVVAPPPPPSPGNPSSPVVVAPQPPAPDDRAKLVQQADEAIRLCRYAEARKLLDTARGTDPDHPAVQRLTRALHEAEQRALEVRASFIQWRGSRRPEALRPGTTLSPDATLSLYIQPQQNCTYASLLYGAFGAQQWTELYSSRHKPLQAAQAYWFPPQPVGIPLGEGSPEQEEHLCLFVSKAPLPETYQLQALLRPGAVLTPRLGADAPISIPIGTRTQGRSKNITLPSVILQAPGQLFRHCLSFRMPGRAALPMKDSASLSPKDKGVLNAPSPTPPASTPATAEPVNILTVSRQSGPVSMRAEVLAPLTYITFKDALKRWIEQWLDPLTPRLRHRSPPASLTIELTLRDGSKCDGPGVQATLKVHVVDAPETPLSTQSGCDKNPEVAIAKALCYLHPPEVYSPSPCLRNIDSPEAWGMFSGGGVKTQVGVHLQ